MTKKERRTFILSVTDSKSILSLNAPRSSISIVLFSQLHLSLYP
ncbi:hypothetical protein SAMN05443252_101875 [Bacillus sp. OV322]|nr:hypothetical protein SAMN05443252_101875 [Bacillus sp. OV322]